MSAGCKQPPSGSTGHDMRDPLLAGQFPSLLNCNDTYSRKVFVGGLPPDLDDSKYWFLSDAPVYIQILLCQLLN